MKQHLIVTSNSAAFALEANGLLSKGWYYVPDTFKANMSADGKTERFTMLLVEDDEHDSLVQLVKQKWAGGCTCPGEKHVGHMPPPFFESPDLEPQSEDGLTDKN